MNIQELKSTVEEISEFLDRALLSADLHFDEQHTEAPRIPGGLYREIRSYTSSSEARTLQLTFDQNGGLVALFEDRDRKGKNGFFFSEVINKKTELLDVCDKLDGESEVDWMRRGGRVVEEAVNGSLNAAMKGKEWPNVTTWNPRDHGY